MFATLIGTCFLKNKQSLTAASAMCTLLYALSATAPLTTAPVQLRSHRARRSSETSSAFRPRAVEPSAPHTRLRWAAALTSGSGRARSVPQQAAATPRTVLRGPAGAEASPRPSLSQQKDSLPLLPRSAPRPAGTTEGRRPRTAMGASVTSSAGGGRGPCTERTGRHPEGRHSTKAHGAPYSGSFRRIL